MTTKYDVIIIGAGPAGLMAAGRASERGKKVLLIEKNENPGKKLLITGGGRCNLTNKKDVRTLISHFRDKPKALYSLFSRFDVDTTISFFNTRGMETKIEAEDRVFPKSDKARSVLDVMLNYADSENVTLLANTSVLEIHHDKEDEEFSITTTKGVYRANSCIVATGGLSRPETGSTGEGFKWLEKLGHTINANSGALVPVALKDSWVRSISGTVISNVKIHIYQDGKKEETETGKILFTHFGISGPTILNMSSKIGELLEYGDVEIRIDLKPDHDFTETKELLYKMLEEENMKTIKNTLGIIIPKKLVKPFISLADIDGDTPNHSLTRDARNKLIHLIKELPLHVDGLLGEDKAIISAGGVDIREVNFQTMESRIVPNLYIIGDLLDINRPSGGYSLQICWSSGYLAGESC